MNKEGLQPLHYAVHFYHVDVAAHLVGSRGAEATAAEKKSGVQPFAVAVHFGHAAVLKYLRGISEGAGATRDGPSSSRTLVVKSGEQEKR